MDRSPPETLTSVPFSTCAPPTLPATRNATGSRASGAGRSLFDSLAGPTPAPSGRGLAPANHSARQARDAGLWTSGTSGPHGSISSRGAALRSSLVSRLRRQLATAGSTLFAMTWKESVTPSRRLVYLLRASARPISGNGSGSWPSPKASNTTGAATRGEGGENLQTAVLSAWPTPVANDDNKTPEAHLAMKVRMGERDGTGVQRTAITSLQVMAQMTAWPSPNTPSGGRSVSIESMDATGRTLDGRKHTASLEHAVKFAAWPTTRAEDSESTGAHRGTPDTLTSATRLTHWGTPTHQDAKHATMSPSELARDPGNLRAQAANMATWATPTVRDHKDGASAGTAPENGLLGQQVWQAQAWATPKAHEKTRSEAFQAGRALSPIEACGPTSSGSPAATGKPGQLNPAFSRFLQGYPEAWDRAAIRASRMRKSTRRRKDA